MASALATGKTARSRKELLAKLAGIKVSTIGGENETQFEQSLAQLGWTYMADHAPQLLDFLVGFQLVERNNDNTKAVGVFGFKVGHSWLYAPIFFLNGELKGHELLYLKDQDLFVPLDEAWTNYIISQQQQPEIGSPAQGTSRELGVLQPNIVPLSRPQYMGNMGKYSSDKFYPNVPTVGWLSPTKGFRDVYSAMTLDTAYKSAAAGVDLKFSASDLLEGLLASSPVFCKAALDMCNAYPAVEQYLYAFHGADILERSLLACRDRLAKQAAAEQSALPGPLLPPADPQGAGVFLFTRPTPQMSEKTAAALGRRGYVVDDRRPLEKLSRAYVAQAKVEKMFTNPNETGLYDVLTKPGEFKKCLVVVNPKGCCEDEPTAIVIDAESKKYLVAHPSAIYVKLPTYSRDEFQKWFDGLSSPDSLESDATYVLLAPQRGASVPMLVYEKHDNGLYEVSDRCYPNRGFGKPDHLQTNFPDDAGHSSHYRRHSLRLLHWDKDKGQGFNFFNGELRVSRESKAIKLSGDFSDPFVQLGSPVDADLAIQSKTASLRILVDDYEGSLNRGPRQGKLACFWSLISDHGFNEETAAELMKQAEQRKLSGNDLRVRVIYGENYPRQKQAYGEAGGGSLQNMGSLTPGMPDPMYGSSAYTPYATEQYPLEQSMPIDGIGARYTDPSVWDTRPEAMPDPMMMQMAQQAGQTGQKELFDTNTLQALVKNVRQGSLLQSFTPDLMKALDRLGRILFLFYWHNDEFADRYGKNDLPELEDATRNSFETLGELVLFIKERDVEPLAAQQHGEVSVDSAAN